MKHFFPFLFTRKFCYAAILLPAFIFSYQVSFAQMDSMPGMTMQDPMMMPSSFSPNLPMNRDGSGTSWQADESPMLMYMKMYPHTMLMFHGAFFLRYTSQDATHEGTRGGDRVDAPNWMMFMLRQQLNEKNLLSFQSMFSLDQLTEGGNGYPLLFQSGESYHGYPLVDRQHPHDLFAELAVNYTHSFTENVDANLYLGYPGEPALGPVVFMHRLSAMNNTDAALGHHWQDATHITFGVATIGLRYKMVKAEGSIFSGREPDENRFNFDRPHFDSYSYRISVNPNSRYSLQFSQGFIHSPEALEPEVNITRSTASVLHTKQFNHGKFIASTLVWGMNHQSDGKNLHSVLLESNLQLLPLAVYARYEFVQKDAHELYLEEFAGDPVFNINAFTLGLNKILLSRFQTDLSLGVQGTFNLPDAQLKTIYGNHPLGAEIYLKLAPALPLQHSH